MSKVKTTTDSAAPKKAAAKKVATKVATKAATKAPAKKTAAKKAQPKASSLGASYTTVKANIDVGFGNKLYLRGSDGGLSWEKGSLMTCLPTGDCWMIVFEDLKSPLAAKFVLNDTVWAAGEDCVIVPGQESVFTPVF